MNGWLWFLVGWFTFFAVMDVLWIGKEPTALTPGWAVFRIVVRCALVTVILLGAGVWSL